MKQTGNNVKEQFRLEISDINFFKDVVLNGIESHQEVMLSR